MQRIFTKEPLPKVCIEGFVPEDPVVQGLYRSLCRSSGEGFFREEPNRFRFLAERVHFLYIHFRLTKQMRTNL